MKNPGQERAPEPEKTEGSAPAPEVFRTANGLEIFHHAAAETKYVYQEVFEDRVYFRHGINLAGGETDGPAGVEHEQHSRKRIQQTLEETRRRRWWGAAVEACFLA